MRVVTGVSASSDQDISAAESQMLFLKMEVPRQRISLVKRPRLLATMEAAARARLCLLIAPPGYGKTTILGQWGDQVARSGQPLAWLTLDEADGDPRQFLSYIVFALARAGVAMGRLLAHAEQGLVEITLDGCLVMMARALGEAERRTVLVLDDYHRPANDALDALIVKMIQVFPENSTIVLSSRTRPGIGVPQLLAAGLATEINAEPLRLTRAETRQLLDIHLEDAELEALLDHTEGWPVAMQLARLVLKNDQASAIPLRQLTARGGHLSSYLADQVLRFLSDDVVDFLISISILERFNAPLADVVRARTDSWDIMEALEPLQSLLTPLDEGSGWFRYHHLFAEYLHGLLMQRRPQDAQALHSRASLWFEENGFVFEAVKHAREAGDFARCAALIEDAGGWQLILYGGINHLRSLLRLMPQSEQLAHPRILLADAYLKLKDGQIPAAHASYDLAGDGVPETGDWNTQSSLQRDQMNVGVLLRVYEDNSIDRAFLETCHTLRGRIPSSDGLTRGVIDCAEAVGALCVGELDHTEAIARDAMTAMRSANSVLGLNYCFVHAGVAALYRAELDTASAYLSQAREMAEENFGEDSGLKSISDVFWGTLQYWRGGGLDVPATEFARSFQHVLEYDGWLEIYAAGLDVRFKLAMAARDDADVQRVLDDGQALVSARGLRRLAIIVQAQRLTVAMARGERGEARACAHRLQDILPSGCWRDRPQMWRPYQDGALALARWLEDSDRAAALDLLNDLVACCRAVGAKLHLIRALVHRASALDRQLRRDAALADLTDAIAIAAPGRIAQPFIEKPLLPLLRAMKKRLRPGLGDPIESSFLSMLVADSSEELPDALRGDAGLFSPRELDVVQELVQGLTNKEIARLLDMTEHTVKFHLRNIFAKLGVERRTHAIAALQSRFPPLRT